MHMQPVVYALDSEFIELAQFIETLKRGLIEFKDKVKQKVGLGNQEDPAERLRAMAAAQENEARVQREIAEAEAKMANLIAAHDKKMNELLAKKAQETKVTDEVTKRANEQRLFLIAETRKFYLLYSLAEEKSIEKDLKSAAQAGQMDLFDMSDAASDHTRVSVLYSERTKKFNEGKK